MPFSTAYFEAYQNLPEQLTAKYPELNFNNHCYLRIALDYTVGAKWDTRLSKPAYRHLSPKQLRLVVNMLQQYLNDKTLLLQHNQNSLAYRRAWKIRIKKFTL